MSNRIIQLGNLREGTTTIKNPSGGRVFSGGVLHRPSWQEITKIPRAEKEEPHGDALLYAQERKVMIWMSLKHYLKNTKAAGP